MEISIAGKKYKIIIVESEEDKMEGLQNISDLPSDEGMLFIFDPPEDVAFWMKDTKVPLDIVFINEDLEVIEVIQGEPLSEELHEVEDVAYVLEVNKDSGIHKGDDLDFNTGDKEELKDSMYVLNEHGEVQMTLEGGERIFSRPHTKILIKFAKKANKTKSDSDYRALGKRLFKFINIQENTTPEYVEGK